MPPNLLILGDQSGAVGAGVSNDQPVERIANPSLLKGMFDDTGER